MDKTAAPRGEGRPEQDSNGTAVPEMVSAAAPRGEGRQNRTATERQRRKWTALLRRAGKAPEQDSNGTAAPEMASTAAPLKKNTGKKAAG